MFSFFKSAPAQDEIRVEDVDRLLKSGASLFLLDVREPFEVEAASLTGSVNIPLGVLQSRMAEVPKDKPVIVICRSGARSANATRFLRDQGYDKAVNMVGGMVAWGQKIDPSKKVM